MFALSHTPKITPTRCTYYKTISLTKSNNTSISRIKHHDLFGNIVWMPFCIKFVCDKGTDCEKKDSYKSKKQQHNSKLWIVACLILHTAIQNRYTMTKSLFKTCKCCEETIRDNWYQIDIKIPWIFSANVVYKRESP